MMDIKSKSGFIIEAVIRDKKGNIKSVSQHRIKGEIDNGNISK